VHHPIVVVDLRVVERVVGEEAPYRLHVAEGTSVGARAAVGADVVALAHHQPHDRVTAGEVRLHPFLVPRRLRLAGIIVPLVVHQLEVARCLADVQRPDLTTELSARATRTDQATTAPTHAVGEMLFTGSPATTLQANTAGRIRCLVTSRRGGRACRRRSGLRQSCSLCGRDPARSRPHEPSRPSGWTASHRSLRPSSTVGEA
jgi:hypothetical protein